MTLRNMNNNNGPKFHLFRRPIKDYSSLVYAKNIEHENTIIYEKLIQIYTRRPQLAIIDKQQDILRDKFDKANKLRREKKITELKKLDQFFLNLKQTMPTKILTKNECLKNWNKILCFKKRRQSAKKAKLSNTII
jgi:hypothetical protein